MLGGLIAALVFVKVIEPLMGIKGDACCCEPDGNENNDAGEKYAA